MTQEQFLQITAWQKETFPNATAHSKVCHLEQEIEELKECLENGDMPFPKTRLEFADCFLLLFGAAHSFRMSYDDICEAIYEKMEINKKRKWGKPDANGPNFH